MRWRGGGGVAANSLCSFAPPILPISQPGAAATPDELLAHARKQLAAMKVPTRLFVAKDLPRTATGKIQRRHVASHFLAAGAGAAAQPKSKL